MAFDYKKMRKTAVKLISSAGSVFELKKPIGKTVYNRETDTVEREYESYFGKCVKKVYSAEAIGEGETLIEAGDVEFLCIFDDISVVPTEQKDKIVFGNKEYNILFVQEIDTSGNMIMLHKIGARKVN